MSVSVGHRRAPRTSRLLALGHLSLVLLVAGAGPASAHGRSGESTNFLSVILEAPKHEGVTWEIYGGDQMLAVTNTSNTEVTVTGDEGEAYLRVGPDGVFENRGSKATYVNRDRYAEVGEIPGDVGPGQEPRWAKVSDEPTYAWYDHRIHWMSIQVPAIVADQSVETLIKPWEVAYLYGEEEATLKGELRWVPPPSPFPWLGAAAMMTAPALLGLRARREERGWARAWIRPAALVLLVVSVLNITHLIDDFLAIPAPLTTQLIAAVQTALFIAIGVFGAIVAMRGRDGAFTALGVGSAGIMVGQGILYLWALRSAGEVSIFPGWWTRLIIALSLMQVLWVGAIAVIGNRRLTAEETAEAPQPTEVTTS